ncbi:hypothetical protein SK128_005818 [Halocaridina rubra]|uniref:Uncharacterized protein n=1 Tax=Halocaridina rubra TaxID=373956 RepID=A0AAN8WV11_HALRR
MKRNFREGENQEELQRRRKSSGTSEKEKIKRNFREGENQEELQRRRKSRGTSEKEKIMRNFRNTELGQIAGPAETVHRRGTRVSQARLLRALTMDKKPMKFY